MEDIQFISDKNKVLWIVAAYRYEDGWHFAANEIYGNQHIWPINHQVFIK